MVTGRPRGIFSFLKKPTSIETYVIGVVAAALLGSLFLPWGGLVQLPAHDVIGLASLIGIGVLSEGLAIGLSVPKSAASITFLPFLTAVVLFGPAAGAVLLIVTGLFGEWLFRKKEPIRVAFNIAQWVFGTSLAGGTWFISSLGNAAEQGIASQLFPFFLFTVVFLFVNLLAVSFAIAISQHVKVRSAWQRIAGRGGINFIHDLLIAPVSLAVAFLYQELWLVGLAVSLLPLLFIRAAYLNAQRLEDANKNLLKALVKAIETRDPYTSGHSLRVARLSRMLAERMGLQRKLDAIETAALLHDVGKIDPVYIEILRKPASLSDEERRIIESHVTKGVEILRSLTSFSNEIILAVQHHHERVDGKGYPDRLEGDAIPIGARIIKVADAIDAMLSDRPYRKALSPIQVREQLTLYASSQFDATVVEVVLKTTLLEDYTLGKPAQGPLLGHKIAEQPPAGGLDRPGLAEVSLSGS